MQDQQTKGVFCWIHRSNRLSNKIYICLEPTCQQHHQHLKRILCDQCIDEQRHSGHIIYSLHKFENLFAQYIELSLNTCHQIKQKLQTLKTDIHQQIQQMEETIIGMISLQNTTSINRQNLEILTSHSNINLWNQILSAKKEGKQYIQTIQQILVFKEEIINEQIENILEVFNQNMEDALKNISFVTVNRNLIFNPDDMHDTGVGLALNRNTLEAVEAIGKEIVNSFQGTLNNKSSSSVALTGCKLAFLQTPINNYGTQSYKINKVMTKILIGCTDFQSHQIISEDCLYENCQKYIYGISVCSEGEIIAYCKSHAPRLIPNLTVREGDIIEIAVNSKQGQICFVLYRYILEDFEQDKEQQININISVYGSVNGDVKKIQITTLELEPRTENENKFYMFAGVAKQGDEVTLVDNMRVFQKQENWQMKLEVLSKDDIEDQQMLDYLKD